MSSLQHSIVAILARVIMFVAREPESLNDS